MSVPHSIESNNPLDSKAGATKSIKLAGRVLANWETTYNQAEAFTPRS
jgi:hypothetical protein